jgi:dihydrofolate synthase/folylpolyglutamate synthase
MLLKEVEQKKLAINGSLFAAYTAAALLWFERMGLEYAVLETGLGGRLDPTNVVTPEISVITSIGFDHMDVLGKIIKKIAKEKAGIIKEDKPVVTVQQMPEADLVIRKTCGRKGCALSVADNVKVLDASLTGQTFETDGRQYGIRGIGERQPEAAALAALTAREMGFDEEAIRSGLARTVIPCRTQYIPGKPDVLLDGAHNGPAVASLCRTLDRYFAGRKKVLLFACMKDKDYADMAAQLASRFEQVVVTCADPERGMDAGVLKALFDEKVHTEIEKDPRQAFDKAAKAGRESAGLLVVCGSFYLAGKIRNILG